MRILRVDASPRLRESKSRLLTDMLVKAFLARHPTAVVVDRDLAEGLPLLDERSVVRWAMPAGASAQDTEASRVSEELISELRRSDVLVLGIPIYNLSVPAVFKAWVDLVCREGRTFRITNQGPKPLLAVQKAVVALVSHSTKIGSDEDFASGWIQEILAFLGVRDVELIAADNLGVDPEKRLASIESEIAGRALRW